MPRLGLAHKSRSWSAVQELELQFEEKAAQLRQAFLDESNSLHFGCGDASNDGGKTGAAFQGRRTLKTAGWNSETRLGEGPDT
jgi:hypothetical protein